jgi:hypothetical protein
MVFFALVEDSVACVGAVSSSDAYVGFVLQGQVGSYLASRGRLASSFPSSPKKPPTMTVQGISCPTGIRWSSNKTFEMTFFAGNLTDIV